ncbi:MAG: PaaI family thioesterase [Chloroflexota bacterium]
MRQKQPNSRHCFVCGVDNPVGLKLNFYITAPGEITAEIVVPEPYQGYPGITHGGIIAAMLDEAAGRSQMGEPDAPRFMYTARLNVQYRKNVPTGTPLKLVGRAGAIKKRVAEATSAIYHPDGTLLAEAEAVLVDIPADKIPLDDLDQLGWKVYPDEVEEAQ